MQTATERILEACNESQTLRGIRMITGYSWQKIAKVLSTNGIIVNNTQSTILELHEKGKTADEISKITGFAYSTVTAYLPRSRPAYLENRSKNALRIDKCRKRKFLEENIHE